MKSFSQRDRDGIPDERSGARLRRGALAAVLAAAALPCRPLAAGTAALRSTVEGRTIEVLAEGPGDQAVGMAQDGSRLVIRVGAHRILLERDGRLQVDGVARPPVSARTVRIVIRGDRVDIRPGQ